ncbi:MAG: GspE/PulE family protein [Pseudanabaenaceae cyanobacterium SKYGB_i_bin29]|nr:GspE/PulE family protein [Pseudanabaenaceae cyanobacterium SKYG29]MDW8421920.1 GspE/PulE family protein [Pseudanabaenaceae cyanobacterium SKYGB_i_bin29]
METENTPRRRAGRELTLRGGRTPFETKLINGGHATPEQYDQALKLSKEEGTPLIAALESIINNSLPPDVVRYYKTLQLFELRVLHGIETIDPVIEEDKFAAENVSALMEAILPINTCRDCEMLPLARTDTHVLVGMVSPDNFRHRDELLRATNKVGLTPTIRVITKEDFLETLDAVVAYQVAKQRAVATGAEIDEKVLEIQQDIFGDDELEDVADQENDLTKAVGENSAPIIKLVDQILVRALKEGVSDIHIEPQEKYLRVRFRKDGVLREMIPPNEKQLPKSIIPAVISRFKIISNLDIAERRKPQDGKLKRMFQGRRVDFRVNTCPTQHGEKVVLRILDNSNTQLGLDRLITDPETLAKVKDMVSRPYGLILVTGPTGSGKTTTLYSALAEVNDPGINISTAEDPIEYNLPGLAQCQVIREKGMDFASILRAFLRQDPDVILVGETRDYETAKTAIEAALTGHLVLTTLHTNDAPGAVARLEEMGIDPVMVSTALIGVCAQRLMRRVCDVCRIPYKPTQEELDRFGLPSSDLERTFYKANRLSREEIIEAQAKGKKLCPKCGGNGYKGRVGVYEVMKNSEALASAINKGATADALKEIAVKEGMKTLMYYAFDLVRQGYTTLEEVLRVVYTDKGREAEERMRRSKSLECTGCGAILKPEMLECPYCTTPRTF